MARRWQQGWQQGRAVAPMLRGEQGEHLQLWGAQRLLPASSLSRQLLQGELFAISAPWMAFGLQTPRGPRLRLSSLQEPGWWEDFRLPSPPRGICHEAGREGCFLLLTQDGALTRLAACDHSSAIALQTLEPVLMPAQLSPDGATALEPLALEHCEGGDLYMAARAWGPARSWAGDWLLRRVEQRWAQPLRLPGVLRSLRAAKLGLRSRLWALVDRQQGAELCAIEAATLVHRRPLGARSDPCSRSQSFTAACNLIFVAPRFAGADQGLSLQRFDPRRDQLEPLARWRCGAGLHWRLGPSSGRQIELWGLGHHEGYCLHRLTLRVDMRRDLDARSATP